MLILSVLYYLYHSGNDPELRIQNMRQGRAVFVARSMPGNFSIDICIRLRYLDFIWMVDETNIDAIINPPCSLCLNINIPSGERKSPCEAIEHHIEENYFGEGYQSTYVIIVSLSLSLFLSLSIPFFTLQTI